MKRTIIITATAFITALIAFSAVMVLPLVLTPAPPAETATTNGGRQGFCWVVVHDEGRLTGLIRITADTTTKRIQVVGYPPETEVVYGVEVTTAAAMFSRYRERVTSMIDAGDTVMFSVDGLTSMMGRLVGNLPLNLRETAAGLTAGRHAVTPLQVAALLRHDDYEDGGMEQARIHAEVMTEFLQRVLIPSADLSAVFAVVTEYSDTRLHIAQFAAIESDLPLLCTGASYTAAVAAGEMTGVGERRRFVCRSIE